MRLSKYKLGELIEACDERNADGKYGINDVKGLSIQKKFIETKANMDGVSLKPYILVKPDMFCYVSVTSRNGEKITLAYNYTQDTYIVSSSYIVFKVKKPELLDSFYLFMYFNRSEFDRYSRFNSWGSAREVFSWEDMCDIDIELPEIEIQRKYVAIYKAMQHNLKVYESKLNDLKLVCDGYIEDLRRKYPCEPIGKYLNRIDVKNTDNKIKNVKNVSVYKCFNEPTAKVNRDDLKNYKIVKPRQISFVQTTHNEKVFAYAINRYDTDVVVSSVNEVFETDYNNLLPEYLCMFFSRKEFDRYARFHSWGSARETFTWDDLVKVSLPIPKIEIQENIAKVFDIYYRRKQYVEILKKEISNICPILIAGAIKEAKEYA